MVVFGVNGVVEFQHTYTLGMHTCIRNEGIPREVLLSDWSLTLRRHPRDPYVLMGNSSNILTAMLSSGLNLRFYLDSALSICTPRTNDRHATLGRLVNPLASRCNRRCRHGTRSGRGFDSFRCLGSGLFAFCRSRQALYFSFLLTLPAPPLLPGLSGHWCCRSGPRPGRRRRRLQQQPWASCPPQD